jgi:hypothetical protein
MSEGMRLSVFAILLIFGTHAATGARLARADGQERPDSYDLLGYFPKKDMQSRIRAYQFRSSFLTGPVTYSSANAASDAAVSVAVPQLGFRLEVDRWFQNSSTGRRTFGISADFQRLYVGEITGITGDPIRYTSGSVLLGWRFLGYGHTQPWSSEASLLIGPALENFPVMQVSFSGTTYRLSDPRVLGTRLGVRARFPIWSRFQLLSLELAGFVTIPHLLLGDVPGTLGSGTRSLGGNALVDFKLFDNVILGVGGYLGWFTLGYTADGAASADKIVFFTQSFVSSLRVLF